MNCRRTNLIPLALAPLLIAVLFLLVTSGCESLSSSRAPASLTASGTREYLVVDTGQTNCHDNTTEISSPASGQAFYGQDAQSSGVQPSYKDNGDGTVTDLNTDLMWQQDPGEKLTYDEAVARADAFNLAGYDDWRLPTIKELYSLILFSGLDPSGVQGNDTSGLVPFIDTDYFSFSYGDPSAGERIIDSQWVSSTEYVGTTMGEAHTVFGVNFADGRIKGYGTGPMPGQTEGKGFFAIYVRGNTGYGNNSFSDNGDGTITDSATGLMWSKEDSTTGLNWEEALAWVQQKNSESYLGHSDWRLPDAKELQSIVDYSRSPDTTSSAAIDPVFDCTQITNEAGQADYPFYWTGTTHANMHGGSSAAYVCFGRGLGYMHGQWIDVHGAGCQRSDPKAGDPADYPEGHGPQGDAVRIYNYVRCVRDGGSGQETAVLETRQAAHNSVGVTDPSRDWYLAEGSTGADENGSFETWVLVGAGGAHPAVGQRG